MFNNTDLIKAKKNIEGIMGSNVKISSKKGRKKTSITEGVICGIYPSLFTVQVVQKKLPTRKISFTYTDLLTRNVEITLCDAN